MEDFTVFVLTYTMWMNPRYLIANFYEKKSLFPK